MSIAAFTNALTLPPDTVLGIATSRRQMWDAGPIGTKLGPSWDQVGTKLGPNWRANTAPVAAPVGGPVAKMPPQRLKCLTADRASQRASDRATHRAGRHQGGLLIGPQGGQTDYGSLGPYEIGHKPDKSDTCSTTGRRRGKMNVPMLIDALALPTDVRVDQRVPKKLLLEQGAPTAADKRQIQNGIEEMLWIAGLSGAANRHGRRGTAGAGHRGVAQGTRSHRRKHRRVPRQRLCRRRGQNQPDRHPPAARAGERPEHLGGRS